MENGGDYFTCDKCHKQTASVNRMLHELRCTGLSDARNSSATSVPSTHAAPVVTEPFLANIQATNVAQPTPPPPPPLATAAATAAASAHDFLAAKDTDWACPLCTCLNAESVARCSACDTLRENVTPEHLLEHTSAALPLSAAAQAENDNIASGSFAIDDEVDEFWLCDTCTLLNTKNRNFCSACDTRRPGAAAAAAGGGGGGENNSGRGNSRNSSRRSSRDRSPVLLVRHTARTTAGTGGDSTAGDTFANPYQIYDENIIINDDDDSSGSSTNNNNKSSSSSSNEWTCEQCTLKNPANGDYCSACDSARPPRQSAAETLLPPVIAPSVARYNGGAVNIGGDRRSYSSRSSSGSSNGNNLPQTLAIGGAAAGAAFAWLNREDVALGALAGGGLGLTGGLLLEQQQRQQQQRQQLQELQHQLRRQHQQYEGEEDYDEDDDGNGLDNVLGQLLAQLGGQLSRDTSGDSIDGMSYEQLLQRFPTQQQRTAEDVINTLPVRVYEPPGKDAAPSSSSAGSSSSMNGKNDVHSTCSICLEEYEAGATVKTLPCFHSFHCECIDHWLRTNHTCPVCKHSLRP